MHKTNLSKSIVRFFCIALAFLFLTQVSVIAAPDAKRAAELMVSEKKIEKEKEKVLIKYFIGEGNRLFAGEDYDRAAEQYTRALEVDPNSYEAKNGLRNIQKKLGERRRIESPAGMSKKLFKSGQGKYSAADYESAMEDFQNALILDYENRDILEWLKKTRRRMTLDKAKTEDFDLEKDINVATKEKGVEEKRAMLEVERAYQPPKKPERKPVEIEEIISPEAAQEEKARRELLDRLKKKMVPAVSLTDADIRDVIRQLMEITNVTIVIDEGALAKVGGGSPMKITFSTVNEMPLLEVLNIALRATELGYRIEPNYIWISTPEKLAKEDVITRTYRLKYGVRRVRKVELKEFETKSSSGGSQ
ncbi:MAG: hypothetical protein KKI13_05205 [Candidatus Omnitrophica bacterium]|nr:hypothetical protein [Candidatus Omnitrophota bacterium]